MCNVKIFRAVTSTALNPYRKLAVISARAVLAGKGPREMAFNLMPVFYSYTKYSNWQIAGLNVSNF